VIRSGLLVVLLRVPLESVGRQRSLRLLLTFAPPVVLPRRASAGSLSQQSDAKLCLGSLIGFGCDARLLGVLGLVGLHALLLFITINVKTLVGQDSEAAASAAATLSREK